MRILCNNNYSCITYDNYKYFIHEKGITVIIYVPCGIHFTLYCLL